MRRRRLKWDTQAERVNARIRAMHRRQDALSAELRFWILKAVGK